MTTTHTLNQTMASRNAFWQLCSTNTHKLTIPKAGSKFSSKSQHVNTLRSHVLDD